MTVYGWDASNYDWDRGPVDLNAARRAGILLFTHKVSEGNGFHDEHSAAAQHRAMVADFAVIGGYHVLYPASMASIASQVDWYLDCLAEDNPRWRDHPCFIHQIDAEKFGYMSRAPNLAEIHAFGDGIIAKTGCDPKRVVAYAPHWLYGGNSLRGLRFTLWASGYGANRIGGFKALYPGDDSSGWDAYSGVTPKILQYGSQTTIGSQPICDANAIRVGTEAELLAIFRGDDDDVSAQDVWGFQVESDKGNKTPAAKRLVDIEHATNQIPTLIKSVAQLTGLVAALAKAVSESHAGVDLAAVEAAAKAGADAALDGYTLHLDAPAE